MPERGELVTAKVGKRSFSLLVTDVTLRETGEKFISGTELMKVGTAGAKKAQEVGGQTVLVNGQLYVRGHVRTVRESAIV